MNDQDPNAVYDTVQKETVYEVPDQPGENGGILNDDTCEDLMPENDLYATELEPHEYELVSVYTVGGEKNSLASSHPEEGGYLLPDEVCPEPHEDTNISMEELYTPIQDQEPSPEEPQENGNAMKEDLPSPSSCAIQESSEEPPACYSAADGLKGNESASTNPEINLYVKVRAACGQAHLHMRMA